jgi:two-component system chemotaxis response regulator CheB
MRVLVVDDSAFMRKIISEMISSDPSFQVVGTARDGKDGVEKALNLKPDLITLDIEMPKKDGLSALREIKARCRDFKPAVLMCSSLTSAGSHEALKAMRIGASDVIGKDPAIVGKKDAGFKVELLEKLRAIGEHRRDVHSAPVSHQLSRNNTKSTLDSHDKAQGNEIDLSRVKAVVVGSSTGGPPVLEEIFSKLTAGLRVPIIVAQHMPKQFTISLAARLDKHSGCSASLASHGSILSTPGIHIAQGGSHIKPTRIAGGKMIARLIDSVPGAIYRPSVDLLFKVASELFGKNLLAIQLTGMGSDGAIGAAAVKRAGGQIIAQSAASSVVYGMPKAVIEENLADQILAPIEIRDLIAQLNSTMNLNNLPEISHISQDRQSA